MGDEVPPSPTSVTQSSQKRDKSLLGHRFKLQKRTLDSDDPDKSASAGHNSSLPNRAIHKPLLDEDDNGNDNDGEGSHSLHEWSYLGTASPTAKRMKLNEDVPEAPVNPRMLNYDSDGSSIRHPPFDSDDDSGPGVHHVFDLDSGSDSDVELAPKQPFEIDLSQGSKLRENLLNAFYGTPKKEQDSNEIETQPEEEKKCGSDKDSGDTPPPQFGGEIPAGAYLGFTTAAGKKLEIEEDNIFMDPFEDSPEMNDDLLSSIANESSQRRTAPIAPQAIPQFLGFRSAGGKNLFALTAEDLKQAKEWEKQVDGEVHKALNAPVERESNHGYSLEYMEKVYAYDKKVQAKMKQKKAEFLSPEVPKIRTQASTPIPGLSGSTYSQEVSAAIDAVLQDSEFFLSQLPVSPTLRDQIVERKRKRYMLTGNARRKMLKSKVTPEMEEEREKVIQSLIETGGEGKPKELRKPFKSEFIERKLCPKKVALRNVFRGKLVVDSKSHLSSLAFNDLLDFQFDTLEFLSNELVKEYFAKGVPVDHFLVPMTEWFKVGVEELQMSFFAAKGIDPKLISEEWFRNAFKMVVWKLVSMELQAPEELYGEWLTLANVLNSLHHWYYTEIDCSKRSILRECLEMDQTPGQLMTLLVADIQGDTVFLSDGHYSVKTKVDHFLEDQIFKGRIRRGIKLMVDGAEFVNLAEGYAPFEVPDHVALRIYGNSTRRCRWDTRLGRFYGRRRLKVPLNSVDGRGGLVAAVDLLVLRKYPPLFVSEDRHRNERMHRRYRKELETRHFNLFERLFHKVEQELVQEEEETRAERMKDIKYNSVAELTDFEDLYTVVQSLNNPQYIEDQLPLSRRKSFGEYKQRAAAERLEKINQRVKEKMNDDLSSFRVLLRLKVTDLKSPSIENCAELWIWNPSEELTDTVTEDMGISVENVIATGVRNKILQLKAGRKFVFKELKGPNCVLAAPLPRTLTNLSTIGDIKQFSPLFLEFDVVVLVLKVFWEVSDNFQRVLATDDQSNVICLNFWNGLQEFACEDLVKPGRVISFSNLQWRRGNNWSNIPNGYATELTVLTTNPRRAAHVERMQECKAALEEKTLEGILELFTAKYAFLKDIRNDSCQAHRGTISNVQSPIIQTPLRPMKSFVTPARLQTPLIERQLNLIGEHCTTFQSPKTPISSVSGPNKRRFSLKRNEK